jgi:hypothetical protein
MRLARYLALLVGLATVGFAVGDWASHPNFLGVVGLGLLIVVFSLLLGYLFRPDPALKERRDTPPERKPQTQKTPPKAAHVWAEGWNAEEAQAARDRRRR